MHHESHHCTQHCGRFGALPMTRRELLARTGLGFGGVALAGMLSDEAPASHASIPHERATAKSAILLFMGGGPSHIDTFDPKPDLARLDGKQTPESITKLFRRTAMMGNGTRTLMASPFRFRRHGESGIPVSNLLPAIAEQVDDLCVIRSMQHDTVIHMPGEYIMTTGTILGDRPSLGAWVTYGLGSENHNLPAFVVLGKPMRPTFAAGFLPARYQGTRITDGTIPHLENPDGMSKSGRQAQVDYITQMNELHHRRLGGNDAELEARIRSYELAFRMQATAPEAFDLGSETTAMNKLYGIDHEKSREVGTQCLLARRLVERGVRFVQVYVDGWDSHEDLHGGHLACAERSDRPVAGLLADLKQRGMRDSTLVVWGGEFGRTPGAEKGNGRDHSPSGFTVWLAGGGVKGGQIIGETDPVGYTAIERPIHPNSLHATMLHALGLDQEKVVFPHNGRDEIPTFVYSDVVSEVFG